MPRVKTMRSLVKRALALAVLPVLYGFLILWTEQQTLFTAIQLTQFQSESRLTRVT